MKVRFSLLAIAFACLFALPVLGQEKLPAPRVEITAECVDELKYVCDDSIGFATVRVSSLMEKLNLKNRLEKMFGLGTMCKELVGVALNDVERCTVFVTSAETGKPTLLVRLSKPLKDEGSAFKNLMVDGKKFKCEGKDCVSNEKKGISACVIDPQTLVFAATAKEIEMCLKQGAQTKRDDEQIAEALQRVAKHDFAAWGTMNLLGEMGLPVPASIEDGMLTVDVGEQFTLQFRIGCDDESGKEFITKGVRSGIDLMRGQILMVAGMMDGMSLFGVGGEADMRQLQGVPLKLMRLAEKGLQQAKLHSDESSVTLTVDLPIDAKTLRSEITNAIRLFGMTSENSGSCVGDLLGMQTWQAGMTLPSPQYLQPAPQYLPPPTANGPATPATLPPNTAPGLVAAATAVPVGVPYAVPVTWTGPTPPNVIPASATLPVVPQPSPNFPQTPTAPPTALPQPTSAIPQPPPLPPTVPQASPIPPQQPVPVQQFKLSVANVRKEPALLFVMNNDGKMIFMQKVPAGEAVDVDTRAEQKWIAVYGEKPAGETFIVSAKDRVWLLR